MNHTTFIYICEKMWDWQTIFSHSDTKGRSSWLWILRVCNFYANGWIALSRHKAGLVNWRFLVLMLVPKYVWAIRHYTNSLNHLKVTFKTCNDLDEINCLHFQSIFNIQTVNINKMYFNLIIRHYLMLYTIHSYSHL